MRWPRRNLGDYCFTGGMGFGKRELVQTRFLVGPSGCGKTYRCVEEARNELKSAPDGSPLLFISPKQATFQIEHQLLDYPDLAGFTRMRILPFDELAELVLSACGSSSARLLSEEGRLMVLRALLARKRSQLKLYRPSVRMRGFAQQLSGILREMQQHGLDPSGLRVLSRKVGGDQTLALKLHDFALLLEAYFEWLQEHQLQDGDQLLSLATEALRLATAAQGNRDSNVFSDFHFEKVWIDGFAEFTPQETEFLVALLPWCGQVTIALNIDLESVGGIAWVSTWSLPSKAFQKLRQRLALLPGVTLTTEILDRGGPKARFARSSVLAHMERHWASPAPLEVANDKLEEELRVVVCPQPLSEATLAAREILRFVRAGGRYREIAVIVRNLESYFDPIRRVFARYEIPFFFDRREPVGHHPLAELTRNAFRTILFEWETEDWFGALKSGLVHFEETAIDRLENEALARGWNGKDWLAPLKLDDVPQLKDWLEPLREKLVAPFVRFEKRLGKAPSGVTIVEALSEFWAELGVEDQLHEWSSQTLVGARTDLAPAVHATVWEQMQEWLRNLEIAFGDDTLSLRDWLPILEAGLGSQTVGVIPPALDQVLIGAIDRSRNPDLRLVLLLGLNDTVFPAVPTESVMLTSADRDVLSGYGVELDNDVRKEMSWEQYLGYIACTRARERLVITYALQDENEKNLGPSPFIDHLRRLFPRLEVQTAQARLSLVESEHAWELACNVATLSQKPENAEWLCGARARLPLINQVIDALSERCKTIGENALLPSLAEAIYGAKLETSVSRIEEYAACPFRFFVASGLRAEERKLFRLDVREQGSFQHEVLARFHRELRGENKQWREIKPDEARARIRKIAERLMPEYQGGLLEASEQARFTVEALVSSLETCVGVLIGWMQQYQFDPHSVELAFGIEEKPLPAWEVDLAGGHRLSFRGKIDRIDLFRDRDSKKAMCVVVDYKSGLKKLDPLLLEHGVQLQLPAYLNVLRALEDSQAVFGVDQLIPAGVFYVNLRGKYSGASSRRTALAEAVEARLLAYQHTGRFDVAMLSKLDSRPGVKTGDQFNFRLKKDGSIYANCREALASGDFLELLAGVEGHLRRMGNEIYEGKVCPDPYRKGSDTACDFCEFQSICRIDPWTHPFRVLRAAE